MAGVAAHQHALTFAVVRWYPRRWNHWLPAPLLALLLITALSTLVPEAALPRLGAIPQGLPTLRWPQLRFDDLRLLGGLPGAGATMRTVTNVQAGGRTPLSGMVHAVVLLLTVFWDLVTAVVIGVSIANVMTIKDQSDALRRASRRVSADDDDGGVLSSHERQLLQQAGSRVVLLSLEGPLSFGASRYLTQLLNDSDVYACLVLDLSAVSHLGVTASLAIDALCRDASQQGRRVLIAAPQPRYRDRLTRFGIARYGGVDFCASRTAALELAASSAAR